MHMGQSPQCAKAIRAIRIENDAVVWQALRDFQQHPSADFSECLIGRHNACNECACTYTFDKKASKKLKSFKLIE
jgi:predicted nucleic-acid-binding protein